MSWTAGINSGFDNDTGLSLSLSVCVSLRAGNWSHMASL